MTAEETFEREARLRSTTDAQVWAREFIDMFGGPERCAFIDEGLMIGWFANAIETGRAAGISSVATNMPDECPFDCDYCRDD